MIVPYFENKHAVYHDMGVFNNQTRPVARATWKRRPRGGRCVKYRLSIAVTRIILCALTGRRGSQRVTPPRTSVTLLLCHHHYPPQGIAFLSPCVPGTRRPVAVLKYGRAFNRQRGQSH